MTSSRFLLVGSILLIASVTAVWVATRPDARPARVTKAHTRNRPPADTSQQRPPQRTERIRNGGRPAPLPTSPGAASDAVTSPLPASPPTGASRTTEQSSAPPRRARDAAPPAEVPPELDLQTARAALVLVGADPMAEAVWVEAINDPDRSAHDRSDLIEDLNEEGFPDPKHVTLDDLPLIQSRIALIERLAPEAMDEVNLDAFAEAYKDLVNMYLRLAAQ